MTTKSHKPKAPTKTKSQDRAALAKKVLEGMHGGLSCKYCGHRMWPGIAMSQTWSAGIPDFPGQDVCITMSPAGPGRVIDCMKCPQCGYSVSIGEVEK